MIIDCHGHYTSAPAQHTSFHDEQLARLADPTRAEPALAVISDDEIAESIEANQLAQLRQRGEDLILFSPQASMMHHHITDRPAAVAWARASNDLIYRITELFPESFAGVCQLPQTPSGPPDDAIAELRRCVGELGFVGCNLSPDPSGGYWSAPPMTDPYWYPLYEAMVELDVPAMIHVSSSCRPGVHTLGAHYLNADTTVFMQLIDADLFAEFPALRFVIPHGGGAVPYHWGRYRGLAERLGRPPLREHLLRNVFFDTCVYHQPGIELLVKVVGVDNVVFASEMLGAVRGIDSESGYCYDDTKRYVDALSLTEADRRTVYEANALRVYPRLGARLRAAGRLV